MEGPYKCQRKYSKNMFPLMLVEQFMPDIVKYPLVTVLSTAAIAFRAASAVHTSHGNISIDLTQIQLKFGEEELV